MTKSNTDLDNLRHRIDLLVERLENVTDAGHTRNNHIYYLQRSMDALEEGEPQIWINGVSNIRFVADLVGLKEMADDADKYLEMLSRRGNSYSASNSNISLLDTSATGK